MMRIVICGAGQVGFNLARYLADHDNHVTVIDSSQELISRINERLDVRAVYGQASHPEVLLKAGIAEADMLIAVTQFDEVNMITCEVVNALFKVKTKIARIRNQSYLHPRWNALFSQEHLSIDYIISPEVELARAISRSMTVPGAFNVIPLADGLMKVIAVRCNNDTPLINTPISHLNGLYPGLEIAVIGIVRGEENLIPVAKDVLKSGDEVYFVVDSARVEQAMQAFGYESRGTKRLVILGGGNVGLCLAEEIEANFPSVRTHIIEKNQARAQEIANILKTTIVLCGDCLDTELLQEANVKSVETVVALTQDDRVNTLASVLAKRLGARRTLALVSNSSYSTLVTSLGVDAVINPRALTVSRILQNIYRGRVRSVYSLGSMLGEVLEAEAAETSTLIGQLVAEINEPREVLVAALVRKERVILPTDNTVIENGDRIIMMVAPQAMGTMEKLFSSRLDYF
jgi:trk system potassium uptake protein TrkA